MTTTQTSPQDCRNVGCDQVATYLVHAQHFDPDLNDDGRPIGWSRVRQTPLCSDCLEEWRRDELTSVCDAEEIRP